MRDLRLITLSCFLAGGGMLHALPGLSPVWERLHNNNEPFSDNNPQHAPTADPDGDGWNNLRESIAGTDPFSGLPGAGFLQVTCNVHPYLEGKFLLEWQSQSGKNQQLEYSGDLITWTPFGEFIPGRNGIISVVLSPEADGPGAAPDKAFWRVRVGDSPALGGLFNPWEMNILMTYPGLVVPGWNSPSGNEPVGPTPPNSDGAGGDDYTDVAPSDNQLNWTRSPDARYLFIPVNQVGIAVDMNDQGKLLFQRIGLIDDYTTDEVGVVYDPFVMTGDRATKVMFNPGNFKFRMWTRAEDGDTPDVTDPIALGDAVWPPPEQEDMAVRVMANVWLLAIGDDGSVMANVDYALGEFEGGDSEDPTRLGEGEFVFLWNKDAYASCRILGDDRGYQANFDSRSRNRVVGFYQKTDGNKPGTRAVITDHATLPNDDPTIFQYRVHHPDSPKTVEATFPGEENLPSNEWAWGEITPTGKIHFSRKIAPGMFQHVVGGTAQRQELPISIQTVSHFTDMPSGGPQWAVGNNRDDLNMWNGTLVGSTALRGILGFDRIGVGAGNGSADSNFIKPGGGTAPRHIWQNGRWFDLQLATNRAEGNFGQLAPKKITRSGLVWLSNENGTSNGILVPVRVKDNLPAKGVDDESIRVHPTVIGYQDRVWIMAPCGNDHNNNPNQNQAEFMLPLGNPAILGIAAGAATTNQPTFALTPDPATNSILWHGAGNATTDYAPVFSLSGQNTIGQPVGVKVMKHRKAKVKVYKIAKKIGEDNGVTPDPTLLPSEEGLETYLNELFGPQINCYFDVSYADETKIVDFGETFDQAAEGHSADQDMAISEFGGLDGTANIHIFIVGKNGKLAEDGSAVGFTTPVRATCWILGKPSGTYDSLQDVLETIGHEVGHVFFGEGHPDGKNPNYLGPAPLYGTDRSKRLMRAGGGSDLNSRLTVKAEWDQAEAWMAKEEEERPMNP